MQDTTDMLRVAIGMYSCPSNMPAVAHECHAEFCYSARANIAPREGVRANAVECRALPSIRRCSCLFYCLCCAVAISEAQAICSTPCTAVAQAVASVPSVYECATGDPNNATDAAKAQAPSLGVPSDQVML